MTAGRSPSCPCSFMSVSHCMATSSGQDWSLLASQVWAILAAQELLIQHEYTLHLAEAGASAVLQLLEHQKQGREEKVSSIQELALSWSQWPAFLLALKNQLVQGHAASLSSSISCRIEDTEACKEFSIGMGCSGVILRYSKARLLGLQNSHLTPLTMLISWCPKPASGVMDHSHWLSNLWVWLSPVL